MAKVNYTKEQRAVLSAEGKIIVSASAGSGKTFVMIERMLQKILAGVEVERMLALTFTKKAAAQMREKIQKSIIARLNSPDSTEEERVMLKRQLTRLPMAQISTIHSFCSNVIRSYFFLTEVNGAFEVMAEEDADGKSLQSEAIEEVFSEAYENADEGFLRLLSVYYKKKRDNKLKEIIVELYRSLRARDDYIKVLEKAKVGDDTLFDRVTAAILKTVQDECKYLSKRLEEYIVPLQNAGNIKTVQQIYFLCELLKTLCAPKDYFSLCAIPMPAFPMKESIRKADRQQEKELVEQVAFYKEAVKNICKAHLCGKICSKEEERRRFDCAQELAGFLADFILRFEEKYTQLKREKAKLDYNDLEHFTLQLFQNTNVVKEIRGKYDYVFVDEYQDINPVQEKIISAVSDKNVFMVGDVKQSIYGFRGSKSKYFTQKQEELAKDGQSLFLTSNFRSANAILEAVNRVFCLAMREDLCGIDYAAKPMFGGEFYQGNQGRVQVHLVNEEEVETEERGVYSVLKEYESARTRVHEDAQAKEILHIIDEELGLQYFDLDEKRMKPVTYGDIALLSRKKGGDVSQIVAYLSENGVPVSTASKVNICAFAEIRQLIDILSLLDNQQQDIPLCSALLSGMGGLTNADLAAIRLRYERRKQPFRDSVKLYAEQFSDELSQKLKKFYVLLEKYVMLSQILSGGEVIERLIGEAGLENDWLSRGDGTRRLARIRTFALHAQDKNVHEFLEYLKSVDYSITTSENAGENAVKVLTMHASKGLEYPVVILIDLDAQFHGADHSEVLLSEEYGIAPKCYDKNKNLVYGTLLRNFIDIQEHREEIKSELNLLYVAMTRAKYALHLVMDAKGAEKYADPFYARKYSQLLPLSCFEGQIAEPYPDMQAFETRQPILVEQEKDEKLIKQILENFNREYPYVADTDLPVKSSASDMMQNQGQEGEYYAVHRLVPEEEESVEKTLIGTAYHAFLEHADFSKYGANELERMRKEGVLPEEQLALISAEKAQQILSMPVFKRLRGAQLYPEQQFLVLLPANAFFETKSKRQVLFQGFIDLYAVTESGVEIVDYKYSSRTADSIRKHYAPQIKLYKKAVAKIMNIAENTIKTTIVNIQRGEEIPM